jgi:1-acyl-sn-glycerol-3-phosphate acyltransferase
VADFARGERIGDPLDPRDYADKYAMKAAAYALYVRWNAQYLE